KKITLMICEECGETEPRQVRYNVTRLRRRYERAWHLDWFSFKDVMADAVIQTGERRKLPTLSGKPFAPLMAYFFSALDYYLSKTVPVPQLVLAPQPSYREQATAQDQPPIATAQPKTGWLAERARERREAQRAGRQ